VQQHFSGLSLILPVTALNGQCFPWFTVDVSNSPTDIGFISFSQYSVVCNNLGIFA